MPTPCRAMKKYERLGPERFFAEPGFAPTATCEPISGFFSGDLSVEISLDKIRNLP